MEAPERARSMAARAARPTSFLSVPPNVYVGPPGRGTFQFQIFILGNPGGSPEATRRAFNKRFLLDLAEDWQQHGREVFKRVRRESPASYLKVCAMLVPKELKMEHSGGVKAMTDEQIERSIEIIKQMIAEREAGASAKLIEGKALDVVPDGDNPGAD
jgi:hypothetical protein